MELYAIVASLKVLKKKDLEVEIYSDSSYVVNAFRNNWIESWIKNNWITSGKTSVLNQDLWKELLSLLEDYDVKFYKIKGHLNPNSSDAVLKKEYNKFNTSNGLKFSYEEFLKVMNMNILADSLANKGIDQLRKDC